MHVLITVEDTENRANLKLERAVEEVKKLLVPVSNKLVSFQAKILLRFYLFTIKQQAEGEDELKKRQLMELAIINGTYRDSSAKAAATG